MLYNHTIIISLNSNFIKAEAYKENRSTEPKSYTETYTDNDKIEIALSAFKCSVVLNKNIDNVLNVIHEYTKSGDD